jgi:hypothetical protein
LHLTGSVCLTIGTHSYALLRVISGQGHNLTPETWDSILPHVLQNVSPAGREFLHRATQLAQPASQLSSIEAGEMEKLTLRFLASLADSPNWENTVSLVNEHHQTLAHLAVLFRYTTLLEKVAQWGINVDVQDVNGFTALHCAYMCGDLDSVRILRSYGAHEDIQDTLSRRPVDMYIPRTNDQDKESRSSDRTSSPARIPSVGEEEREKELIVTPQPGTFGDQETTTDRSASRRQSLPTPTPSPMCGDLSATDEGWIDDVSELSLSDSPIALEHGLPFIHFSSGSGAGSGISGQRLEEREREFNLSSWLETHSIEPNVGHPSCPSIAEECGARGMSCYTAFVADDGSGQFGCCFEECRRFRVKSVEEAIRHLRRDHFNHRPFMCTPPNGKPW